jgi:hypothetical protein
MYDIHIGEGERGVSFSKNPCLFFIYLFYNHAKLTRACSASRMLMINWLWPTL